MSFFVNLTVFTLFMKICDNFILFICETFNLDFPETHPPPPRDYHRRCDTFPELFYEPHDLDSYLTLHSTNFSRLLQPDVEVEPSNHSDYPRTSSNFCQQFLLYSVPHEFACTHLCMDSNQIMTVYNTHGISLIEEPKEVPMYFIARSVPKISIHGVGSFYLFGYKHYSGHWFQLVRADDGHTNGLYWLVSFDVRLNEPPQPSPPTYFYV